MSQQRQKGTGFESEKLPEIQEVWPDAVRAGTTLGANDVGDYLHTGDWRIEAKKHNTWRLMEWIRKIAAKGENDKWVVLMAADRRRLPWTVVCLPFRTWLDLLLEIKRLKRQKHLDALAMSWMHDHLSAMDRMAFSLATAEMAEKLEGR